MEVTPFMGVWIEMVEEKLPEVGEIVTPFMGVWIEIRTPKVTGKGQQCHSLHGSVD